MVTDLEAERRAADARFGAAEEIAWWLAFFVGWVVNLKTDSMLLAVVAFVAVVVFVDRVYGRKSREAWAKADEEETLA